MIEAAVIKHSVNKTTGTEIITFELVYHRFGHGELLTHRMFSRGAGSSRAIPIDSVIELIKSNPAIPVHWGKNQAGMKASVEIDDIPTAKQMWLAARDSAVEHAIKMKELGLHKQIVNRILEPYQLIKTIVTATDFNNWFWLRNHADAQPEIKELAAVMLAAKSKSTPQVLNQGEWHVPYVDTTRTDDGVLVYSVNEGNEKRLLNVEDARIISASCCAQVSYRKNDNSIEKARKIYNQLIESEPVHASPVEHIATPICKADLRDLTEGVTHVCTNGQIWSGNFRNWIQFRQLIDNHARKG
jgi:thymidylate synthase ThyX